LAASRSKNTTTQSPRRISFAKISEPLEVPQLLALQTDSFDWLIGDP
jgi:DNA-directed RNA polymerase subunit beta